MKLIGNLLVWICVASGLMAASSFYAWEVGADPSADDRFIIAEPAGEPVQYARLLRSINTVDGNEIAAADEELNPQTLARLRDAGVKRVIVKHVSGGHLKMLANWTGKSIFLASAVGLIAGGMLLRGAAKREVDDAQLSDAPRETPEEVCGQIRGAIADLRGSLGGMSSDHEKMHAIVRALGEVQAELVPKFAETRPILIARRGVGGFASVMDAFAAMERKINRSWSAAADGAFFESVAALEDAAAAADQLAEMLNPST
ncbi:MAG: hypothetical protein D6695_11985 [Planctomycetota bacterium]|nr:MAG: hypothetical protein D6695_11985 [Planctomycetota bacterium]